MSLILSRGNCCIISIQRYWTIRTINNPCSIWSRRHTVLLIVANLLICSITGAIAASMSIVQYEFNFDTFWAMFNENAQSDYNSKFVFAPFITSTVSLIVTNIVTVLSIRNLWCSLQCHGTAIAEVRAPTNRSIADITMERNRAATITIVMVVLMLDIVTLPTVIYHIIKNLKLIRISCTVLQWVKWSFLLNSLVNPVIYLCRMHDFRKAIWKDMTSLWCSFKCVWRNAWSQLQSTSCHEVTWYDTPKLTVYMVWHS